MVLGVWALVAGFERFLIGLIVRFIGLVELVLDVGVALLAWSVDGFYWLAIVIFLLTAVHGVDLRGRLVLMVGPIPFAGGEIVALGRGLLVGVGVVPLVVAL